MRKVFVWETPEEMNQKLADRVRLIRKRKKMSQSRLSEVSNVSLGSIKRFEATGQISLLSLTKLAVALDCENEIQKMFSEVPYADIEEVINENK